MANLSIRACILELLEATASASLKRLPNISSACLDNEDNCLIMLANVPFVTPARKNKVILIILDLGQFFVTTKIQTLYAYLPEHQEH